MVMSVRMPTDATGRGRPNTSDAEGGASCPPSIRVKRAPVWHCRIVGETLQRATPLHVELTDRGAWAYVDDGAIEPGERLVLYVGEDAERYLDVDQALAIADEYDVGGSELPGLLFGDVDERNGMAAALVVLADAVRELREAVG